MPTRLVQYSIYITEPDRMLIAKLYYAVKYLLNFFRF